MRVFERGKAYQDIADENVNVAIVEGLKRRGVDVWSAIDKGNLGLSDEEQLSYALGEKNNNIYP